MTAAMLASGAPQPRHDDGTPAGRHPAWKPHPMQGWTPDFIPKITGDAVDMKLMHQLVTVTGARRDGVQPGSGQRRKGSSLASRPVRRSRRRCRWRPPATPGANILCMLPDTGERYLSTPLFADVPADMTEEEQAIFRSTPYGVPAAS